MCYSKFFTSLFSVRVLLFSFSVSRFMFIYRVILRVSLIFHYLIVIAVYFFTSRIAKLDKSIMHIVLRDEFNPFRRQIPCNKQKKRSCIWRPFRNRYTNRQTSTDISLWSCEFVYVWMRWRKVVSMYIFKDLFVCKAFNYSCRPIRKFLFWYYPVSELLICARVDYFRVYYSLWPRIYIIRIAFAFK